MNERLKNLLSEKELKKLLYLTIDKETKIKDLTVLQLSFLFIVLDDFENLESEYIISCKVLEILINRTANKELATF